jgi:hypothetical protein
VTEIHVAQGTYLPDRDEASPGGTGDREATFQLIDGVALMGGYAGSGEPDPDARDVGLYVTVLSGDLLGNDLPDFMNNGENSYNVATGTGTDPTAVLDGFTITAGNANGPDPGDLNWVRGAGMWNLTGSPTLRRCRFEHNYAASFGGGAYNRVNSSPLIEDCRFTGNVSGVSGGAMFNYNGSLPQIIACTFVSNHASGGSGGAMFNQLASDVTITGCTFDGNSGIGGGAILSTGSSATISGCAFSSNVATGGPGGAVSNFDGSNPVIADSSFTNNDAGQFNGGAIINLTNSHATVTGCTFSGNTGYGGGAIRNSENSRAAIDNCTFANNIASNIGGGVSNYLSNATLVDCTFDDNTALAGGGLYNYTSSPIIRGCAFRSNQTTGAGVGGGVVNSTGASPSITNCLFAGNSAGGSGGGLVNAIDSNPTIANCTIVDNTTANMGGGVYTTDFYGGHSTPVVANCIVYGNNDGQIVDHAGSVTTVSYSNVQGGHPGPGNIDADPLFVDAEGRLSAGSPCIDAAHNWLIAGLATTDLDGNPRFADDPATPDTGCGVPVVVDMGAYEFAGNPFPVKLGDIDGDGVVGITDFLVLLGTWGPCLEACCLADLDFNGDVGVTDFLVLLANWG